MNKFDLLCLGELAIDEIGHTDKITDTPSSSQLKSIQKFYGGRGGNFSVSAGLFKIKVAIIGALGKDPEGKDYKKYLSRKGIDTSYLFESELPITSRAYHFNEGEKTRIFFYAGALIQEPERYVEHAAKFINKLSDTGILCGSNSGEINRSYLTLSKAEIKAFSPAQNLPNYSRETLEECIENATILFLNDHESKVVENILGTKLSDIIRKFKTKMLIKTLGSRGSKIELNGKSIHIPPCKPVKVTDPTGAGDAFAGAFMANFIKTHNPVYSARMASATASFIIEEFGTQTNLPTLDMVKRRAKENYSIDK